MALFKMQVVVDLVVEAETADDAQFLAIDGAADALSMGEAGCAAICGRIESASDIGEECLDDIPYGGSKSIAVTLGIE